MTVIQKETTNKFEFIPSLKATEAVIADTKAEWLEGIPPVRQAIVARISRPLRRGDLRIVTTALSDWEKSQLDMADKNIGFSKKALSDSALIGMVTDII
jgi:hypothetical protein